MTTKRNGYPQYQRVENRFFQSVGWLCSHYNLRVPLPSDKTFPQNVIHTYQQVKKQLQAKYPILDLCASTAPGKAGYLSTTWEYEVKGTLLYVPVEKVVQMVRTPGLHEPLRDVVISTCAYLHQVLTIPVDPDDSYVGGELLRMVEWYEMEDTGEEQAGNIKQLEQSIDDLRSLQPYFNDPAAVVQWEQRINRVEPKQDWEYNIKLCCSELLALYRTYPKRTFRDNIPEPPTEIEREDIFWHDYLFGFFCGDADGHIDSMLHEQVNINLQECWYYLMPQITNYFDGPITKPLRGLEFECLLRNLINDFSYYLNQMPC